MAKTKILSVALFCLIEMTIIYEDAQQPINNNLNQDITKKLVIANKLYNRNQKFNIRDSYIRRSRPAPSQLIPVTPNSKVASDNNINNQLPNSSSETVNNQLQTQTCPTCKQILNHSTNSTNVSNQQLNSQKASLSNSKKLPTRKSIRFGERKKRRFKYQ